MPHMVIEDVRKGMDTRRAALAAPDGTLTEGLEGHITPGGNFEKRKAFTKLTLPAGTFGLQPVPAGLLVFGSGTDPGGFPNDADGNAVTYQRLQHPAVLLGETYSAGSHAMTAVVFSDVYGGKAFVIAQFADGKRYCYYDGSLVRDFTDGLVLAGRTTTGEIAADFEATVDRTANYTASTAGSVVSVTGPAGAEYQVSVSDVSALGTLAASKTSAPTKPVAGNKATGSFRITGGSNNAGVNKISKVEVGGSTITGGAVNWVTSNEVTAAALAANITSAGLGYTAEANGALITLTATTEDDAPNNSEVKITCAGNVCCGEGVFQFSDVANEGMTVSEIKIDGYASDLLTSASLVYPGTYTTLTALVAQIATEINTNTATHGFLACATGGRLAISKAVTSSNDTEAAVSITYTGGGIIQIPSDLGVILPLLAVARVTSVRKDGKYNNYMVDLHCDVSGGTPPYYFRWTARAVYNWAGVLLSGLSSQDAGADIPGGGTTNPNPRGYFSCQVTDSGLGATKQIATTDELVVYV